MYRIPLIVSTALPEAITPEMVIEEHTLLAVRTVSGDELLGRVLSVTVQAEQEG